jgi:putative Mg2+ transporter-C (MgtC) family protein
MGLAIGIGFYKAAVVGCVLIFFSTVVLHRLDNNMLSKSKVLDIYMEIDRKASMSMVLDAIKNSGQALKISR